MKATVVGYGSIGERHARILGALGCSVSVVSRRPIAGVNRYSDLSTVLIEEKPNYIVVANETDRHFDTLKHILNFGFTGAVLMEKPLFYSATPMPGNIENVFVGYNLRFHPLLEKLRQCLSEENVISVQAYVGKYLPEWRPQTDYSKSYSSKKTAGGGVLRDLSHEIDYLFWMLGPWKKMTAIGGHFSSLQIDSDDMFTLLMTTEKCPSITLQMNYLDRFSRREIIVTTDRTTYKADLIQNELWTNKDKESFHVERDDTYIAEHQAVFQKQTDRLCTYQEGLLVLEAVEAAERAAATGSWETA